MASDLDLPDLVSSDEELEICDASTETYVRKWIDMGTEKLTEEERKLCDYALLPLLSASDAKAHVPDLWINALQTVGVFQLNDRAERGTLLDGRGSEIVSYMKDVVEKNRHVVRDAQALRDILDMIIQIEKDCVTEDDIDPDGASNTALTWPFFHDAWKVVMTDLGKAAQFCLLFFYKVVQHNVTWYGHTGCLIPEVPETISLMCMLQLADHDTEVKVVTEDDYDRYASLVAEALVALHQEDNPVRASDKFQSALDLWSHSNSVKSKLTPDDVLVLRYACAISSVIQDGSKTIAEGMEMLQAMQREFGGDAFPLLYYGLGQALTALYRFKDALVPVETGLHLAESLRDRWTEVCWPTSEHVIEESKLPVFKRVMGELRTLCHYPPAAHATCSMHVNHDGDGVHIYFHSPMFSGYTQIWCHLKCRITFHPQCWKHFKATIADKVADKDVLNQPCPTPNCGAVICKIFLCRTGSKGNKEFKSAIPPPKKAPGNHKLGRMVVSNPDRIARKAERREIRLQKRQEAQLKDGGDEDGTAGVAESRNHLQEDKTEGSSTTSVALTKLHRDQDQGVKYQGFHKSVRQKKKKEKVKHVLNVEVNFSGNREATLLGEDDADPEHNKTSNSVNDGVANPDPYKVPQRLQADVQRLEGMVAWTAAAQSRLANSTIMENLLEYFAGTLSEHGPLSLSGPLLSREMADLPEEAKRAVTALGGPAGFFRQSLKFVVIGDIVANIGDTTRAHELARWVYGAPDGQGTSGQGRLQVAVNSNVTELGPSSTVWQNNKLRSGILGNFQQNTPYSIALNDFQSRTYRTVSQQNNQHQSGTANSVSLLPTLLPSRITVHPEAFHTREDFGNVSQTSDDCATAPSPLVGNTLPKLSQAPGTVSQASGTSNDGSAVSESVYENGTLNGQDSHEEITDWWSRDYADVNSGKMPVADVDVYNKRSVADDNLDYARTSVLRLNPAAPAFEPGQSRRTGERHDFRNSVDHEVQSNVGGSTNQKLAAACTDGNNVYGHDDHAVYSSNRYVDVEQTFSPHKDMYVHDDQTSCQSRNKYVDGNAEDWSEHSQQCMEDIDDIDDLSMAMHAPVDECLSDMDTIDDTIVLALEDRYLRQSPSCSSRVMKEADGDMLSHRSSRSDLSQTSDISTGGLFHSGSTGSSASSLKGGSACDASSPHAGRISSPYAGHDMSSPHTGRDVPSPQTGSDVSSPVNRMREFSSSPQSVCAVSSSANNSQGQGPSAVTGSDQGYCSVNTADTGSELGQGENFATACLDRSTLPQSDSPTPPSLSDSPPPPCPTSPQVGASISVHEKPATLPSSIGHKYSVGTWDSDCMLASNGQPTVDVRVGASVSNVFSGQPALSSRVNGMYSGVNVPQPLQPLAPVLTPPFAVASMPVHVVRLPQAAVVSVPPLPPLSLPPVLPTAISHVPMASIPTQSGVSYAYHSTVAQTSPSSVVSFPSSEAWTNAMTRNQIVRTSSLLTSSYHPSLRSGSRETLIRGAAPPPIPLPAFSHRPGGNQAWTSDHRVTSSEDKQLAEVGVQTEVATRSVQINTDMDVDAILRSYHALGEENAELMKQLQTADDEEHDMQALVQQYQAEKIAVDRQLEEIRQERNKAVQQMNNLEKDWAREKRDLVEDEAVLEDRIKSLQEQNSLSSLEKGNLLQRASEAEKRQRTETHRARSAEMEVVKLRMQLSVQQLELRKSEPERHHQYTLMYAKRCQEKGGQVPDKLREVLKYWQAVVEAYNDKQAEIQRHYDNQLAELSAGKRLEDLPHVSFSPPSLPRMPEAVAMLPMNGQPLALQGVSDAPWDPSRLSPPLFGSQARTTTTGTAPNGGASHVPSSVTSSAPRPLVPPNPSMLPLRTSISTTRPPLVPPLPLRPMATLSQASTALSTANGSVSLGPVNPFVHAATSTVNSTGSSMHKGFNASSVMRQPLRPPLSTTLSTPAPALTPSGLYASQHTDALRTSVTGWVPGTGVSGWVPVSDDHSAAGRGTVSQMAITSRPLPQTFNSVLTLSAPRPQVNISAAPQSSFDKLVVTLQKSFPACTRDDFSRLIQELRRAHGGSLSGMSLEFIVTRITQMLVARGVKAQGPLATEKSLGTPHSHPRVAPPPGLNPAWSVEGVDEERAPSGADRFEEEDPCAICVDELSAAPCITLECSHRFHDACLRKWYEHNSTCPNCRIYAPLHDEFPSLK